MVSSTRMLTCHRPAASKLTVTVLGSVLRGSVLDHRIGNGSRILASVSSLRLASHLNALRVYSALPPWDLALNLG